MGKKKIEKNLWSKKQEWHMKNQVLQRFEMSIEWTEITSGQALVPSVRME